MMHLPHFLFNANDCQNHNYQTWSVATLTLWAHSTKLLLCFFLALTFFSFVHFSIKTLSNALIFFSVCKEDNTWWFLCHKCRSNVQKWLYNKGCLTENFLACIIQLNTSSATQKTANLFHADIKDTFTELNRYSLRLI